MTMHEVPYITTLQESQGGFNFDLHQRNCHLLQNEVKNHDTSTKPVLRVRKTGTTICGIVTDDGIILGADTRATEGPIIAMKNCEKLHQLTDNIYIAGAGVSADLHHVSLMMKSKLELLLLTTHRQPRVITAVTMFQQYLFRYQGHITCAIVLGGIDCTGPQLYKIFPHGSCDRLPFCAMGSGSLNALAVLESSFKDDLNFEEGKDIVARAIRSGVMNDLGSGGNVDLVLLPFEKSMTPSTSIQSQMIRAYVPTTERPYEALFPPLLPPRPFLREHVEKLKQVVVETEAPDVDML